MNPDLVARDDEGKAYTVRYEAVNAMLLNEFIKEHRRNETQQQQQAVASAQESLQLFTNRYKGGVDTYLQVITAQTIELANERNAIDILRRRLDASIFTALATFRACPDSDVAFSNVVRAFPFAEGQLSSVA